MQTAQVLNGRAYLFRPEAFRLRSRAGGPRCRSQAVPLLQGQQQHEGEGRSGVKLSVRLAQDAAELRAAAHLRAASFYTYPADRSAFAQQSHRRMKADAEWQSLEDKVAGRDQQYKSLRVWCLIAAVDDVEGCPLAAAVAADESLDRSGKLPAVPKQRPPQVVVGSLDINQGASLPSEEMVGKQPDGPLAGVARAYLSNVCVASAARRQGVAMQLIGTALEVSRREGVQHMYVHVAADNLPAVALYTDGCGFQVEAEESEATARSLNRPRRLLLRKDMFEWNGTRLKEVAL